MQAQIDTTITMHVPQQDGTTRPLCATVHTTVFDVTDLASHGGIIALCGQDIERAFQECLSRAAHEASLVGAS